MTENETFRTAMGWLELGIATLPIQYRSKSPDAALLRKTGYSVNGRAEWRSLQQTLPKPEHIRLWTQGFKVNLAVVTGWQGLVVLDFDTLGTWEMYQNWLSSAPHAAMIIEDTYQVRTGRGVHVYLGIEEPVRNGHVGAIDIKAAGGYVLCPPSLHPSGRPYQAVDRSAPVLTVERLVDVFPFALTEDSTPSTLLAPTITTDDPWQAAETGAQHSLDVEAIKRAWRVEELFPDATQTGGPWWLTCCPLHDDANPSFWINTDKQICGCYAGCTRKPLDVIDAYAKLHRLSNRDAMTEMMRRTT